MICRREIKMRKRKKIIFQSYIDFPAIIFFAGKPWYKVAERKSVGIDIIAAEYYLNLDSDCDYIYMDAFGNIGFD